MSGSEVEGWIARQVLAIHHRNGGTLQVLDLEWRLLEPALGLDSLDLAEVIAGIEREYGVSVFDHAAPRTWRNVVEAVKIGDQPQRGCAG